eukprot:1848631-Heterocapsa_arctica.AAC.1
MLLRATGDFTKGITCTGLRRFSAVRLAHALVWPTRMKLQRKMTYVGIPSKTDGVYKTHGSGRQHLFSAKT